MISASDGDSRHFRKLNNMLINLWEIKLFSLRGLEVFLKIPVIMSIRLGEINVLGGGTWCNLHLLFLQI